MRGCGLRRWGASIELVDIAEPRAPRDGELLVAVEAAGVGQWDGFVQRREWDVGLMPPAALSVEGTGRVLAAGADVDDVTAGAVVFGHVAPLPGGSGFCAARALVTAAQVALRPEAMTPVDAAALPVAGLTATQALDELALHSGDRLLITGAAGGTGALALQLAARRGARIVATASTAHRDRLLSFGADEVLDYHEPDALRARAGSFDAALVAARGTATDAIDAVRAGGRLCSITSDAPPSVRGISTRNVLVQPDATALASLAQLVTGGELILAAEPSSLADAPTVFTEVIAGQAAGAKRVVVLTNE
jgi:NADPH:quinone reductase-like Zn-dependent oxidoreductase